MCFKKPHVIKFEQNLCNASVNDNSVLFVRVTGEVQTKNDMFEIPFTHVGYVIKGGNDARIYPSGHYDVFDDRKEIKNWKKGFSVEIIYMPKETSVLINWGTPNKVKYRDEASNKVINVGARGQFGITITNHEQFFRKVVGTRKEFDLTDFRKRFSAAVVNEFADCFLAVVRDLRLTYDQFDANRKSIGEQVGRILSRKFEEDWGIALVDFIIEWFEISKEDTDAVEEAAAEARKQQKLQEYLAELERLDDKQWERERYLRQLELEDRAAYYEVLKVVGHPRGGEKGSMTPGTASLFCPQCGNTMKPGDVFCPHCGKRVVKESVICPHCGKSNDGDVAFCSDCGTKLK